MLNPELRPGDLNVRLSPQAAPRVVVVEDCPGVADLIKSCVRRASPDAEVRVFADGDAAWACLETATPNLLISDLVHPGMRGVEMLGRLALNGVDYPIIMASGMMGLLEPQARRMAGPQLNVHYWVKPFLPQKYVYLLKQCLDPMPPQDRLLRWSAMLPRPLKIVQLDDEECVFRIVTCMIHQCLRNVQLYQFQHGADAWRILTEARPDLLITGDRMGRDPEWTGASIVRRLVAQRVEYPILVASGWPPTHGWVRRVQVRYPKCFYLLKPFSADQFCGQLARAFGPFDIP